MASQVTVQLTAMVCLALYTVARRDAEQQKMQDLLEASQRRPHTSDQRVADHCSAKHGAQQDGSPLLCCV